MSKRRNGLPYVFKAKLALYNVTFQDCYKNMLFILILDEIIKPKPRNSNNFRKD